MVKGLVISTLGSVAVAAVVIALLPQNTDTAAKVKCEFAIEDLTALEVPLSAVRSARVTGDDIDGTVVMPFTFRGRDYTASCVFEHGRFRRVTLNGQVIAAR